MYWEDKKIVWEDELVVELSVKYYGDLNQLELVVTIRGNPDLKYPIKERIVLPGDSVTTLLELLEGAKAYRGQEQHEDGDKNE